MLNLIINNSDPLNENISLQEPGTKPTIQEVSCENSFLFAFQEISPNLYAFNAQNPEHELSWQMSLERKEHFTCSGEGCEEASCLVSVMAWVFPHIEGQKFQGKALGDGDLQGMLMCRFQLKILDQLLLFCDDKDAATLTILDSDLGCVEVYRRFFISEEKVTTARGEQTQIVIPVDIETYDEVLDFIDEIDKELRRLLGRDQNVNPAFRGL